KSGVRFVDDVERNVATGLLIRMHGAIDLRRYQRVRETQVSFADQFVIGNDIAAIGRVVIGEVIRVRGAAHHHGVEKIRASAKHAGAPLRPGLDHVSALDQVGDGSWFDVAEADALAGGRRDVGHRVDAAGVQLEVVKTGNRAHAPTKARIAGYIGDAFAIEPHLTRVAQAV